MQIFATHEKGRSHRWREKKKIRITQGPCKDLASPFLKICSYKNPSAFCRKNLPLCASIHSSAAFFKMFPFSYYCEHTTQSLKICKKVSDEENIDFHAKDNLGWTQFIKACINGHKEIIKSLLEYTDNKTLISMQKTFMVRLFGVILKH